MCLILCDPSQTPWDGGATGSAKATTQGQDLTLLKICGMMISNFLQRIVSECEEMSNTNAMFLENGVPIVATAGQRPLGREYQHDRPAGRPQA